jgi:ATP-dependent Clp protease ATP-binding subunit ClpB
MTINPERWTVKTQEAFASAVERARSSHNAEVTPEHVLAAVLDQPDGIAGPVLTRLGSGSTVSSTGCPRPSAARSRASTAPSGTS